MESTPPNASKFREIVDPARIARAPLVSVVMTTYNHEAYIAKAIEGVVQQETEFPFELIIGEDCSTDGTRRIACQYQERFPKIIRIIASEQNGGAKQNSERLRNGARGTYLAYCEGDDFWHNPHKLQKQVKFLEENLDYGLVHSNYDTVYLKNNRHFRNYIRPGGALKDDDAFVEILAHKRSILTLTVCLRRDLLGKVIKEHKELTDPAWPMGDTQAWLEIARLAKVKYLPESLATYHILMESASQSQDPEKVYRFRVKARELILHYIRKYDCPPEVARQARAFTALCLMYEAYYARQNGIMDALLSDAKQHYVSIPITHLLYYYGARNRVAHYFVKPGLLLMKAINKVKRMFGLNVGFLGRRILPMGHQTVERLPLSKNK